MEIPHDALSAHTLAAVIEEYITREGTDYGDREFSLAQKVEQVRQQLKRGEIFLSFDPQSQTCHLAPRQTVSVQGSARDITILEDGVTDPDNE